MTRGSETSVIHQHVERNFSSDDGMGFPSDDGMGKAEKMNK